MNILMPSPEHYFELFYVLGFLVSFICVIRFGVKHNYPLRSTLLLMTIVSLCTIVGSRLITIPFSDWDQIIGHGSQPDLAGRSAVGGAIFGIIGLIIAQKALGFGKSLLDVYAWLGLVTLGIHKLGCFVNGCCYGVVGYTPLSVQYPKGANAHFHHWSEGLIGESAAFSLEVLPTQAFEALALFALAFVVWRTRNFWTKTGSALLFSFVLFFLFRFSFEFLRDPSFSNIHLVGGELWGLNTSHWLLLVISGICGLLLFMYEKYLQKDPLTTRPNPLSHKTFILYLLTISSILILSRGLFSSFEWIAIQLKYIPALVLSVAYLYQKLPVNKYRLVTASLLGFPLAMFAQTFVTDTLPVKKYKRLDVGLSAGNVYNTIAYNPRQADCGTQYSYDDYKQVYQIGGLGYSQIVQDRRRTNTYGVNVYGGVNREMNLTQDFETRGLVVGVNPYAKFDFSWVGFGLGLHLGNLRWIPSDPINERVVRRGTLFSPVLPDFSFRLGRKDLLNFKYSYGFQFPSHLPGNLHELSAGSGFGRKHDYSLRFGLIYPFQLKTLSAEGLFTPNMGANLKYIWGKPNRDAVEMNMNRFAIGVHYRFDQKDDARYRRRRIKKKKKKNK